MPARFTYVFILFLTMTLQGDETPARDDPGLAAYRELCMACHLQTGMGIREMQAPSIAGLPRWYVSDQLRKFRRQQRGFDKEDTAGNLMRANALALEERAIPFLGKFIESLPPNQSRNILGIQLLGTARALYAKNCAECHGERAEGKHTERAPPLTSQQDWYLLGQMEKFTKGTRNHGEAGLPEDLSREDIEAIIAWICRLPAAPGG